MNVVVYRADTIDPRPRMKPRMKPRTKIKSVMDPILLGISSYDPYLCRNRHWFDPANLHHSFKVVTVVQIALTLM